MSPKEHFTSLESQQVVLAHRYVDQIKRRSAEQVVVLPLNYQPNDKDRDWLKSRVDDALTSSKKNRVQLVVVTEQELLDEKNKRLT
ncbi:hypothetical protein HY439_02775 [Candidatus Microgenomates bacterium]|nr:hypothetical protein [Candidatus Microgenomates bacterium]